MPSPAPSSSVPSADSATLLTVEIRQSETAEPVGYVLECSGDTPGPNTTLPNATQACATVQRLGADFFNALPDANVACTQQYGGPQTASISGTVDGTQVRARFALTDGCEISRWNAVRSILGSGGAV
ncbi:SSI family serine proteinase inhibitor [Arthrobacter sp. H41]|uniref:SSI family serine proteinase inhibitor n=1 Tax=Arthrobacter sp. H41 TaxID=1312978 RepID=UPI0004B8779D|nr:SSI family serine proteinase inhibitor [Arthrobacter sp. H41]